MGLSAVASHLTCMCLAGVCERYHISCAHACVTQHTINACATNCLTVLGSSPGTGGSLFPTGLYGFYFDSFII